MTKSDRNRGIALVEIIVSLLLAGVAFASVAASLSTGLRALRSSRETEVAIQAAQREMEDIRNTSFSSITTHPFDTVTNHQNLPSYMSGTVVVDTESSAPQDGRKKVSINVSWASGGRNMRVDLVTHMTENGINRK